MKVMKIPIVRVLDGLGRVTIPKHIMRERGIVPGKTSMIITVKDFSDTRTVDTMGRILICKEIRDQLDLHPKDTVQVIIEKVGAECEKTGGN
jgi:AbrB family looped-hinge helix DNA binding protein